jgi:hypothetical protein
VCFLAEGNALVLAWRLPHTWPAFLLALALMDVALVTSILGVALPLWREWKLEHQPHEALPGDVMQPPIEMHQRSR